jgi:hypothetical protein
MLMNKPGDIPYSEITPKKTVYKLPEVPRGHRDRRWHCTASTSPIQHLTNLTMLRASVTFRPQQNQMGLAPHRRRRTSTPSWFRRAESMIQYTYLHISSQ